MTTTLTLPAGSNMQCIDITITDDDMLEGDETFTVSLTGNPTGVTLTNAMTTVTITDDG